jgi:hypothetical protein
MMSAVAKERPATESAPAAPEPAAPAAPKVAPDRVAIDFNGQVTRKLFARMPQGIEPRHLNESPEIWSRIQNSHIALKLFDELRIVGFDQDWEVTAVVTNAARDSVRLHVLRNIQYGQRDTSLPQDDFYRIVWSGGGYRVARKTDGAFVSSETPTVGAAEIDLRNQYPKTGKVA